MKKTYDPYKINIKEVVIYVNDYCNKKCFHCYIHQGNTDVNPSWIQWVVDNFDIEKSIVVGGEPILSPNLPEVLNILKKGMKIKNGETTPSITLSTNCKWIEWGKENGKKTLPPGPNDMKYMDVVDMLKEGGVKSIQISIEGDKETTDAVRGKGSFQNSMDATDLLKNQDFDVFFRATYSQMNYDNIPYMLKLADEKGVDLMLFPYKTTSYFKDDEKKIPSDLTTLDEWQQEELYNTLMSYTSDDGKRLAKTEIPQYYAYIGMAGAHCPAGRERINIMPDGVVTPCEMNTPPNHFTLGKFNGNDGLDKDLLMERISFYLHTIKQVDIGCMTCDHHRICRSGCRETMEYINCPLRYQIDFGVYQKDMGISNVQLKRRISNVRRLQKKRGGC
jgi:radical SAM protein with 4Fe4S-binding SPASM domain